MPTFKQNCEKGLPVKIQSWMIKSWTSVEWYLPAEADALPTFQHISTHIRESDSVTGLRGGDTVWMLDGDESPTGMAWEWHEVRPGVVMLADPNAIVTNLQIIDREQQRVQGLDKIIVVNRIVHQLPWQRAVADCLQEEPLPAAQPPLQSQISPVAAQRTQTALVPRRDPASERKDRQAAEVFPALARRKGSARSDAAGAHRRATDQESESHKPIMRRAA